HWPDHWPDQLEGGHDGPEGEGREGGASEQDEGDRDPEGDRTEREGPVADPVQRRAQEGARLDAHGEDERARQAAQPAHTERETTDRQGQHRQLTPGDNRRVNERPAPAGLSATSETLFFGEEPCTISRTSSKIRHRQGGAL